MFTLLDYKDIWIRKYQMSTLSDYKDIWIRKFEFVAKPEFL